MKSSGKGHHKGNSTEDLLNKELIFSELNIIPGQTIVDVGCGNGYMSKEFSKLVRQTGKVFALDISKEAIEKLTHETGETNIVPIEADITHVVPIEDASVDLIYLSTVFHIFSKEQIETFQKEAKRLLKPAGKVAIVEIKKEKTPIGPPLDMRVSPEELKQEVDLEPLSLSDVGSYFYMQTFENRAAYLYHMKIRKASDADKEAISRLHVASIRNLCGNHYTGEQLNAWTGILVPSVYDHALREKLFLVAYDLQEDLLGIGILDGDNAEVSAIYVHPDAAGKGVGSRLLNELEKTARNKNILEITVHSTLNATGFYMVHGYSEELLTFHSLPNGSELECVRMRKDLSKDDERRY